MNLQNAVALVTGANRGVGQEFVAQLLDRGVSKVYATARDAEKLSHVAALDSSRVVPLELDVTHPGFAPRLRHHLPRRKPGPPLRQPW